MPFTNKLDTNLITIIPASNEFKYISSQATVELADVIAYSSFIRPNGLTSPYTSLIMKGTALPIVVDETYATIDGLINP